MSTPLEGAPADLFDVTHELECMDEHPRFGETREHSIRFKLYVEDLAIEDSKKRNILDALYFVIKLHFDHSRKNLHLPYLNHILRVAMRLIREYKISDSDILVAAILHDSVEKRTEKALTLLGENVTEDDEGNNELFLTFLEEKFGTRSAELIRILSEQPNKTKDQRHIDEYVEHTREIIQDPSIFIIKLADILDNTIEIVDGSGNLELRQWLSHKYSPLFDTYVRRLQAGDILIPIAAQTRAIADLEKAKENAQIYLDGAEY